jgi:gas vesicle protein
MKYILSFILGVLVGSVVALMFAPTSGEELRTNMKTQVDTQSAAIQEQWQLRYQQLQSRMEKMSNDLQALKKQKAETEPVA